MIQRCYNENQSNYSNYGGRGIKIEWKSFEEFRQDMVGDYYLHVVEHGESNTQIDRIDNNGNYSKTNCRWATRKEQGVNKTNTRKLTLDGETRTLSAWAEFLKMPNSNLCGLLKNRPLKSVIKYRHLFKTY